MIQRIQTLQLILSALAGLLTLLLALNCASPSIFKASFCGVMGPFQFVYLALIGLGVVIAVWSIFLFKTRIRQIFVVKLSTWAYILSYATIIASYFISKSTSSFACIGFYLPLFSICFNILACRRIRFDENLVRSADRLR